MSDEDIRDHVRSFSSLALSAFDHFTLTSNGDPEQLNRSAGLQPS